MSLHLYGKNGKNVPNVSDFLQLKITIRISHKYNQVKVHNLVHFWSPSIALFNGTRTISINDQNLLIFFNWEVTPIFALKVSANRHQSNFRVCLVLWPNY